MPSSRRGLGQRTQISTGSRVIQQARGHTHYDSVNGPETVGIRNRQRDLVQNPSRRAASSIYDMDGGLLSGSSRTRKRALAFNGLEDAKRRRINELAPAQAAPTVGSFLPDLTSRFKDSENLTYAAGFGDAAAADDFHRGITPAFRPAGTNMAWGNMPMTPDSMFYQGYRNMNGNGPAFPGTASDGPFIAMGGDRQPSRIANPLIGQTYSAAATARLETRNAMGEPNQRTKYTHLMSAGAEDLAPEELRYMMWWTTSDQPPIDPNSVLREFYTRSTTLPIHDGFTLTGLNMALAVGQPMPETPAQVVLPEKVMQQYSLQGFIVTDPGAKVSPQAVHKTNRKARLITFQPSGPCDTFNLWGNVAYGDRIYMILKGIDKAQIRGYSAGPTGSYNLSARSPTSCKEVKAQSHDMNGPAPLANTVLQFVPWSSYNGQSAPSYDDVCYMDDFGVERVGIVIFLGTVLQVYEPDQNEPLADEHTRALAPFSTYATHQIGRLRVHLEQTIVPYE